MLLRPIHFRKPSFAPLSLLAMVCSLLSLVGCKSDSSDDLLGIQRQMDAAQSSSTSLEDAFRDLPKMMMLDRRIPTSEITQQLNSWSSKQLPNADWKVSPLVDQLPELIARSDWAKGLGSTQYTEQHAEYIYQCTLMRDISSWVLQQPYRDPLFLGWLEEKKKALSAEEGLRLEQALKLFDWTIRNVALDGNPKDAETLPLSPYLPLADDALGYTMTPWQTIMRARGDVIARARVFSQLAFQSNIPVAWVAFPGALEETPKLWAIAIPVGKEVFLLEPRWGLPLPGPNQTGIATLQDAQQDTNILRRAVLVDQFKYPVAASDIPKAYFLMDIEPMALGSAMQMLERSLTGELRVRLHVDASDWARQFQVNADKRDAKLWAMPWIGLEYSKQLRQRLRIMDKFTAAYMANMAIYMEDSVVSRARLAHLAGKFGSDIEDEGALGQYMTLRIDDATLERLEYDPDLQKQFLIRRSSIDESPEQFQQKIKFMQSALRRSKYEGCLFLSMAHFDLGNYESARSWSDRWMLQVPGTEAWHSTCWYLVGRSLEQLGNTDEAVEFYKKSPSPQEAGNRIRARLLKK